MSLKHRKQLPNPTEGFAHPKPTMKPAAKHARRIDKETEEEAEYKTWVHTRPCVVTGYRGELVQASHVGSGGMGQKKGSWLYAVPMRHDVHQEWGERRGRFRGWSREDRAWAAKIWVSDTLAAWERRG